jgi:hypothetical protein
MNALRMAFAIACAAIAAGCAMQASTTPSAVVTSPRAKIVATQRVKDAVVIGESTKADVVAALGETLVIRFDNAYEVWVYRLAEDRRGEFVILFEPSGVVAKTRIRPAPQRSSGS